MKPLLIKEPEALFPRMDKPKQRTYLFTAGGFGAILLWSTTVAFARSLSEQIGPVTAGAAVYSVSSIAALFSFLRCSRRRRQILRLPIRYLLGCGTLFVGYMLLLFLAIGLAGSRQQAMEAALLNYLWPALTIVLSLALLKKKANWVLFPGTVLALAGVFLVVTQEGSVSWQSFVRNFANNPAAYSLAFIAALLWALYSNLTRRWAGGQNEGAVVIFLPITAVILLLTCCFLDEPRVWSRRAFAEVLFFGVATYLAYALWDSAMRMGNIVMVAAASYLTPLFSTIVSCLYLAVLPGFRLWIGCGVIVLGSILSWKSVSNGASISGFKTLPDESGISDNRV